MPVHFSIQVDKRVWWQVCVCALLIGLLLYNPFLALSHQSKGQGFWQPERHRSTVGASEMQHYSPVQAESLQPQAELAEIVAEAVVAEDHTPAPNIEVSVVPPQPELTASLWFRPPPSL